MKNKNGKMFGSKCCGADINFNITLGTDVCSKCFRKLKPKDINEDLTC